MPVTSYHSDLSPLLTPTRRLRARETGFTLIELVFVMVLIGILSASAMPKYVDLRKEAQIGALANIAGTIGSASSTNLVACVLKHANCVEVKNCQDVEGALAGGLPEGYRIFPRPIPKGKLRQCHVIQVETGRRELVYVSGT
ncbi:MAG: prepilin-type N-terminal cleavage/methylation domain-containing protein [Magnetococcales bacterium]|nr:prepilin-type N-terminal cleavage/methylation domain-containing protein [Magnetococcales bacterium]